MSAFDQVIGYADIKTEMIKYCDVLENPERYRTGIRAGRLGMQQ